MFMTLKKHYLRGSYQRQWGLSKEGVQHIDPSNLSITNHWPWSEIHGIAVASPDKGEEPNVGFTFSILKAKKKEEVMKFSCTERPHLIGEVRRFLALHHHQNYTLYPGSKLTRGCKKRTNCFLKVDEAAVIEVHEESAEVVVEYPLRFITKVQLVSNDSEAFILHMYGRPKVFASANRNEIVRQIATKAAELGLALGAVGSMSMEEIAAVRRQQRAALEARARVLTSFELHKVSPRVNGTVGRVLEVTENFLIEREVDTYTIVSAKMYKDIISLVRDIKEPNKFMIYFKEEPPKTYLCSQRDALLATISFSLRSCSNTVVLMQCRPNAGLVVLGDASKASPALLATTYLNHLIEVEREASKAAALSEGDPTMSVNFVKSCAAMNANTGLIGMNGEIKPKIVTGALTALANQLQIVSRISDIPVIPAAILLETCYRLLYTYHAKKTFMDLSGMQPTLFRFMKHKDETISFWANEVLGSLLRGGPFGLIPRDSTLETQLKNDYLSTDKIVEGMMLPLEKYSGSGSGALVILCVMETLESVLCSHVDSTPQEHVDLLLRSVSQRYAALLKLFRSPCAAICKIIS